MTLIAYSCNQYGDVVCSSMMKVSKPATQVGKTRAKYMETIPLTSKLRLTKNQGVCFPHQTKGDRENVVGDQD